MGQSSIATRDSRPPRVIVGLGEVLWDVFPDGARFGGAPANFACTAAGLGGPTAAVYLASAVGDDELGEQAVRILQSRGVQTSCLQRSHHRTGRVDVSLDASGHATYAFANDTAWDHLAWSPAWQELAGIADAVCFGTLGQRADPSRAAIQSFVAATEALRVLDINLRPPHYDDSVLAESLNLAHVLKLNELELPVVADLCGLSGDDEALPGQLADRFQLQAVAVTRGASGAALWSNGALVTHPAVPTEVVDTVGAGDAFTAALVLGLLEAMPPEAILERASRVAAFVCTQSGATPRIPSD